jgi:hypothetical protein
MTFLLSVHPIGQLAAILVGLYAAYYGYQRIRSLHFGIATGFPRKRHAFAGAFALISMLAGSVAGSFLKDAYLPGTEMGIHSAVAVLIVALGIFGVISGYFLYAKPRKRKILPLIHGLSNFTVLLFALIQIVTGTAAYFHYVLRW